MNIVANPSGKEPGAFRQPLRGSLLGEEEIAAVAEVIQSGAPLSMGVWRERFEEAFRAYLGAEHVAAVGSGSAALRIAIQLLDLRPGDEVIATAQTYKSTIQPILDYPGVRVRFCDVDPNSLNIDLTQVERLLTPRTRAIFFVDYGGFPVDVPALRRLADEHGVVLVEDAAHGIGGSLRGRPIGSQAHYACFSFHGSKTITTLGEGGLIVVPDAQELARAVKLRRCRVDAVTRPAQHRFGGRDEPVPNGLYPEDSYTADALRVRNTGTNTTLPEVAAAVGLVQLRRLPEFMARRRQLASWYEAELGGIEGVQFPTVPAGAEHALHYVTFFVDPAKIDRDQLLKYAVQHGVRLDQRYFPLHLMPEWRARGHGEGACPVTEQRWFTSQVNLPCSPVMSDTDATRLIEVVRSGISAARLRTRELPAVLT